VIEFSLGVLVWIKEFRYWVLLGGLFLHAGIDYTMNIPLFAPIMVAGYLTFVEPAHLSKAFAWVRSHFNRYTGFKFPIPVFYDGKCSFCIRSMEVVKRIDVLRRLEFHDMHKAEVRKQYPDFNKDRGNKEMLVRTEAGNWYGGFYAFRFLAKHLPLCWPILPLLYLPPISFFGSKAYSQVADRRYCIIPQPKS
jgi:predicted DCC family thiol-disulfide oxidoreductase YuxK